VLSYGFKGPAKNGAVELLRNGEICRRDLNVVNTAAHGGPPLIQIPFLCPTVEVTCGGTTSGGLIG
jgi:hypothetical protein